MRKALARHAFWTVPDEKCIIARRVGLAKLCGFLRRTDLDVAEFLQTPAARVVFWLAVLAALLVFGFYLVGKVRESLREKGPTASDLLTNFREMHGKGVLADEEFRTIKSKLAGRIQDELKGNGEKG